MQRVAVFADSHGRLSNLPAALEKAGKIDAFLHLGDFGSDADKIATLLPVPYFAIRGNSDFSAVLPTKYIASFEKASLMMVHGNGYRSEIELSLLAEQNHCQAVLFGHTHTPLLTAQGSILIINPGSLSMPRYCSAPSFTVLTIDGKDIRVEMINL